MFIPMNIITIMDGNAVDKIRIAFHGLYDVWSGHEMCIYCLETNGEVRTCKIKEWMCAQDIPSESDGIISKFEKRTKMTSLAWRALKQTTK